MKLEVFRHDLQIKFRRMAFSRIGFEHFKPNVQNAIREAGRARFWEMNWKDSKDILPND